MDIAAMFLYAFLRFITVLVKGAAYAITALCNWLKNNKASKASAQAQTTEVSQDFLNSFSRRPEPAAVQSADAGTSEEVSRQ